MFVGKQKRECMYMNDKCSLHFSWCFICLFAQNIFYLSELNMFCNFSTNMQIVHMVSVIALQSTRPGSKVINLFSSSTQLSMEFILLMNFFLTFISRIND